MRRATTAVVSLVRELLAAKRITIGATSRLRLSIDLVFVRVARLIGRPLSNAARVIAIADGKQLTYRLNQGDVQSLREVWGEEIYRPPAAVRAEVVVDLGANIGLTTRWMHHHLGARTIVTVEPSHSNGQILKRNVPAGTTVVHAAVGPSDGTTRFASDAASNLGRVDTGGEPVLQVSMQTVLDLLPAGSRVDLLKLDIEGGEEELLTSGDLAWLERVDAIIAEFHPGMVDYQGLIQVLVSHGFDYIPAGSAWKGSMDAFVRRG